MRRYLVRIEDAPTPTAALARTSAQTASTLATGIEWALDSSSIDTGGADRAESDREGSNSQPDETTAEAADTPVDGSASRPQIAAVSFRCESTSVDAAIAALSEALPLAGSVGADVLNLTIPPLVHRGAEHGFDRYQDLLNFVHELLRSVRLAAERAGVVVAIETNLSDGLSSPVEFRGLIDDANSWAIGAVVDFVSAPSPERAIDWLGTLGRRVRSIRIPQPVSFSQSTDTPDPQIDPPIADALDNLSYDGLVIFPEQV